MRYAIFLCFQYLKASLKNNCVHICVPGLASCGGSGFLTTYLCSSRSVYVREYGQDLSLLDECVHTMRGGMVYILGGWSVVWSLASLTNMYSHIISSSSTWC